MLVQQVLLLTGRSKPGTKGEGCIKNLCLRGGQLYESMLEGALSGPIETKCLMYVNALDPRCNSDPEIETQNFKK